MARPGVSLIVSGKAIEKYFDSGSRYLIFITRVLTFFTTSCSVLPPAATPPSTEPVGRDVDAEAARARRA